MTEDPFDESPTAEDIFSNIATDLPDRVSRSHDGSGTPLTGMFISFIACRGEGPKDGRIGEDDETYRARFVP